MAMNSIELFAGGGGLALAAAQSGFKHSSLIELDGDSVATLRKNVGSLGVNKKLLICSRDIREVDFKKYESKIDFLSGGPPCQPFSIGGKSKANNDIRDMFPYAVRALSEIKPAAFLFENVKGLLRENFSKYFNYIILQLTYPEIRKKEPGQNWEEHLAILERHHTGNVLCEGLKYNVVFRLINAADYGIPQKRERVFIVGFRNDIKGEWNFPKSTHSKAALEYEKNVTGEYWERHSIPKKTEENSLLPLYPKDEKKPWITVRDVIADLPNPENGNCGINNHIYQKGAKIYSGHTGSCLDEPSKTIKAGTHGVPGGENMIILDNGEVRYYTIREAARIQTFPDDYFFPCSWTESMRQIGNAVPVKLGRIIIQSIARTLQNATKPNFQSFGQS